MQLDRMFRGGVTITMHRITILASCWSAAVGAMGRVPGSGIGLRRTRRRLRIGISAAGLNIFDTSRPPTFYILPYDDVV